MLPFEQDSNLLINIFKRYKNISSEIQSSLESKIKIISRDKGKDIVKEGQIASGIYAIEKGLVRAFYRKKDTDTTIWFGYEGIYFVPIYSFQNEKPSREIVQCLEDSVFQYISGKDIQALFERYPDINEIGRKMTEECCVILDDRIFSFQTQSAEERYKELIERDAELIKRVPLGYIASYLGISQETLSRVRKKVIF